MKYYSKLLVIETDKQSINWEIIPYTLNRRNGKLLYTALIEYRRSRLKRYEYVSFSIAHYFRINIDFHKPI